MSQSPKVLTCLMAFVALNLNWIPLTTLVLQLSLDTAKAPEIMWLRSTIAPMMMLDHSELENCGTLAAVRMEDLVNLISFI